MKLRTKVIVALAVAGVAALAFQAGASAEGGTPPTSHASPAALPFLPQTETVFHPVNPTRILDTRSTLGGHQGMISSAVPFDLQVTGSVVPAGTAAVEFNLTVVNPTASSFLTVWPAGTTQPNVSNINYAANQTLANSNTVKLTAGGQLTIRPGSGSTNVLVDVAGYYSVSTVWGQQGYVGWVRASDSGIVEAHSSNGSIISTTNISTGENTVTFPGANIGAFGGADENIGVSAFGNSPVVCTAVGGFNGNDLKVTVFCNTPGGSPVDAEFFLQLTA